MLSDANPTQCSIVETVGAGAEVFGREDFKWLATNGREGTQVRQRGHHSREGLEGIGHRVFEVPWFKHHRPEVIQEHANAYDKVVKNYPALLADDKGEKGEIGGYSSFFTSDTTIR